MKLESCSFHAISVGIDGLEVHGVLPLSRGVVKGVWPASDGGGLEWLVLVLTELHIEFE